MTEMQEKAIGKIERESKGFKGDKYGNVVAAPTADALEQFCEGSVAFAEAVLCEDKHFSDCIAAVIKGIRSAISDLDVYKRAVNYFIPDADVKFDMRIILPGEDVEKPVETVDNPSAHADQSEDNRVISLFDIL